MEYNISSGQVSSGIILNNYDSMNVHFSGIAESTTVNGGGNLYVFSGGTASWTAVNQKGYLSVGNGATAQSITENGGYVSVEDEATVTFTPNTFSNLTLAGWGYSATVHSGTTAVSTTVDFGARLGIYSGGTATSISVSSGGALEVTVASDTYIQGTSAGSGFEMKNAFISGFTVGSDSWLNVLSGGTAVGIALDEWGHMDVSSGGTADTTIINNNTWIYVNPDGLAKNTTVKSNGYMYVDDSATATGTTVSSGGCLDVDGDGSVSNTNIINGRMILAGSAVSTTLSGEDAIMNVNHGASAVSTFIDNDGMLKIYSGGTADGITLGTGAILKVKQGGLAANVVWTPTEGKIGIESGGTITFASDYTGVYLGSDDHLLSHAEVMNGLDIGNMTMAVMPGGTADSCSVGADGCVSVWTGASINGLAVNGGELTVFSGGTAADVIWTPTEGTIYFADGATGAWLIQENQTAAWGDLSQRNPGWEIFGTGKTVAGKNTDDVYIKTSDNVIGAWTTGDDGKVSGWETVGEFDSETQIVGLGDFNANGQTDLLLRNVNGAVGCFFTSGEKTGWNYFQSLGDEWKLTAVGDLNGDGRDDVVLKHDAGFAGSWLTQEDGTMAWADLDTLPEGFAIIGAGDFNGDGTDDVLLKSGNYYGAWLVNNGNAAGWMGIGDLGDVAVEQISDFNSDGKADLRIRTAAGDLGTQLVMGTDTLDWKYYGSVGSEWSTALASLA